MTRAASKSGASGLVSSSCVACLFPCRPYSEDFSVLHTRWTGGHPSAISLLFCAPVNKFRKLPLSIKFLSLRAEGSTMVTDDHSDQAIPYLQSFKFSSRIRSILDFGDILFCRCVDGSNDQATGRQCLRWIHDAIDAGYVSETRGRQLSSPSGDISGRGRYQHVPPVWSPSNPSI